MTFPNRSHNKPPKKIMKLPEHGSYEDDLGMCKYESIMYKDYTNTTWKQDPYTMKYEDSHDFFIHNSKPHFESWSDSVVEEMCAIEDMSTTQKIKLTANDLPMSNKDVVKKFKIEYLYEKYEELWNKTEENLAEYLSMLRSAFDNLSKLDLTTNLKQNKEHALIRIFEKTKMRLNESFMREKESILNRHIDSTVDKNATRVLKNWFLVNINNPFPTEDEKKALAYLCDLEVKQVSTWFGNHRGRCKRKILDSPSSGNEVPSWISTNKQKETEI